MVEPGRYATDGLHCLLLSGPDAVDDNFGSGGVNSGKYGVARLVLRVRHWTPVDSRGSLL